MIGVASVFLTYSHVSHGNAILSLLQSVVMANGGKMQTKAVKFSKFEL